MILKKTNGIQETKNQFSIQLKSVKGADVETFELYKAKGKGGYVEYFGKDKNNFYNNTETITLS